MEDDLIKLIKQSKIFASLEDEIVQALLTQFAQEALPKDQILFQQDDVSDSLYILISGRLSSTFINSVEKTKITSYIEAGETVGELSAFSSQPRASTVKAIEDSVLIKLPGESFKKLCQQYPTILFETVEPIIKRSQKIIQLLSGETRHRHIAIIPANNDVAIEKFEARLKENIESHKKITLISDNDLNSDSSHFSANLNQILDDAEHQNNVIIFLFKTYDTPFARLCWEKVDTVYVIADGSSSPHLCSYTHEKLTESKHLVEIRRELVLLYNEHTKPVLTQQWLQMGNFFMHHHVRAFRNKDYQRLIRFFTGKTTGLVLSGGGAKAWAHVGAIKALFEAGITIDAVGGTSVGAVIGGMIAMNDSFEDIQEKFGTLINATRGTLSLKNICWPAISVFNCKDFTLTEQSLYGEKRIEDLWMPYFCISCNLAQNKEIVHRYGYMWEKIRASVSLPGLIPPMVIDGQLHLDGGVMNNLPVDVMRGLLGIKSRIIALELISYDDEKKKYNFPPTLTFKQAFLSKFGLGYTDYKFPPFFDTFIKSMLAGSSAREIENMSAADMLIQPDLSKYGMLNLSKKQEKKLMELGYISAREQILKSQK